MMYLEYKCIDAYFNPSHRLAAFCKTLCLSSNDVAEMLIPRCQSNDRDDKTRQHHLCRSFKGSILCPLFT